MPLEANKKIINSDHKINGCMLLTMSQERRPITKKRRDVLTTSNSHRILALDSVLVSTRERSFNFILK